MAQHWSADSNPSVIAAEIKQLLADGRLDLEAVDDDGRTPLHQAIDLGSEDLAVSLVRAGADVNRRDRWGNTPLWRAVFHAPGTDTLIDVLLEYGADPCARNNHDASPIDLAHKMTDDEATADVLATLQAAAGD